MLDQPHPPARLVAQMRAFAAQHELPPEVADALAARPQMTAARAEALAPGFEQIKDLSPVFPRLSSLTPAEFSTKAVEKFMDAAGDETDPDKLRKLASAAITDFVVELNGMADVPLAHGAPVTSVFDNERRIVAEMTARLTARLDPTGRHDIPRDGLALTIPEIAMQVCRMQGLRPFNEAEAVRMAAHSTSDFPLILENSLSNAVARRIEQRQPDIARASHEVRREDYREGRSLTLSAAGKPREVSEGGEVTFVTAEEKGELLPRLRDFASGLNLTNQAMTNDSVAMGMLMQLIGHKAQGATELLRDVLLAPLLANAGAGQTMASANPMFDAAHGNTTATGATISIESLSEARTAMRKQRGLNGEMLAVEPWALVVPAELETLAQQVLATINATKFSDANPFAGGLELIVEPGLEDPGAWYLVADPARYDGLAHAFLDGQSAPRIESRPGWSTLGMELRLVWALDAKFIETATWFRNPGPSEG